MFDSFYFSREKKEKKFYKVTYEKEKNCKRAKMKMRKEKKNTPKHCHSTNNRTVIQMKNLFRIECKINLTT